MLVLIFVVYCLCPHDLCALSAHDFEMEDERITYEEQDYIVMYFPVVIVCTS